MIAAIVLTHNEERNIGACLDSLDWADRRVVFDSLTEDDTLKIARQREAEVIEHRFVDFASQRNAALEAVRSDWIFFVDADERATPALGREARAAAESASIRTAGFEVPRDNYLFGRLTRGAGYWPDYQMRLLRRGRARYEHVVSEVAVLDGEGGRLKNALVHYNYVSVEQFHAKQRARADLEAVNLLRQGVRPRFYTPYRQLARHFWYRFVTLKGYREGLHGLRLSVLLAYYFGYRYHLRAAEILRARPRGR